MPLPLHATASTPSRSPPSSPAPSSDPRSPSRPQCGSVPVFRFTDEQGDMWHEGSHRFVPGCPFCFPQTVPLARAGASPPPTGRQGCSELPGIPGQSQSAAPSSRTVFTLHRFKFCVGAELQDSDSTCHRTDPWREGPQRAPRCRSPGTAFLPGTATQRQAAEAVSSEGKGGVWEEGWERAELFIMYIRAPSESHPAACITYSKR